MTKYHLKRIELDFEKTYPYFLSRIVALRQLFKNVVNHVDFRKGTFFTLLPDEANMDRLYLFDQMDIIPQNEVENTEKGGWQQVVSLKNEIGIYLKSMLSESGDIFVADDYNSKKNDGWLMQKPDFVRFYNQEVYYVLNSLNSDEDFRGTLVSSDLIWHMFSVVSKAPYPVEEEITEEYFDQLGKETQYVITTAYDGEGIIFWEKA